MINLLKLKIELMEEKRKELVKDLLNMDIKFKLDEYVDKEHYDKVKKSINVIEDMLHNEPVPIEK